MKPRILFIEDESEYFEPLVDALEKKYLLKEVGNLAQAIKALSEEEFDLLLVDIMLPQGESCPMQVDNRRSGLHLVRWIRRKEVVSAVQPKCLPEVPILAITAVSDVSALEELKSLGVDLVAKPFSLKVVLNQVAAVLRDLPHGN